VTSESGRRVVEVAAAVMQRPDGSYLLAQRPAGKVYAGYWEFPGGKVEPGEPVLQALVRELHEELGIEVERAYRWIVLSYAYPHAYVRLHFHRVVRWRGEPHPRERQQFAWCASAIPAVAPILPANGPVLKALSLPTVMGITHAAEIGVAAQLDALELALARGLRLVMVREKPMPHEGLLAFAREVVVRCHAAGARVLINGEAWVAAQCGADGVHLPAARLLAGEPRPDTHWCGASCHDAHELDRARALGLDYVVLGPVAPTASHPGAPALGWQRFAALTADYPLPILALGGLRHQDLEAAWEAGAHGVAMMRGAWAQSSG
jgi:8-oxo-dGTP diphosphatase